MPRNGCRIINYIKMIGGNPSNLKLIVLTHADLTILACRQIKENDCSKLAIHFEDLHSFGKVGMKIVKGPLGDTFQINVPLSPFSTHRT